MKPPTIDELRTARVNDSLRSAKSALEAAELDIHPADPGFSPLRNALLLVLHALQLRDVLSSPQASETADGSVVK